MSCCVLLLDFYHERDRKELYVKYLKKLITLHEQSENWAEAGFTLLQVREKRILKNGVCIFTYTFSTQTFWALRMSH